MNTRTSPRSSARKGSAATWCTLGLVWAVVAWAAIPIQAQRLLWLGTLGSGEAEAYGVSADGSVVVGRDRNAEGKWHAFRWTASGGMQDLGTLGGDESAAYGVSADGSVVVGWAKNAEGKIRAFRWTASGGMQDLGTHGSDASAAYDVSADGSVVVGVASDRAFRWTASGGMQNLGGEYRSVAYGVSADGSVVVGWAINAEYQRHAFRWTASGGMQDLGTLGGYMSIAYGVSADGSVVVGWAMNAENLWHAFRWTASGGMQDLGTLGGYMSMAYGVSATSATKWDVSLTANGDESMAYGVSADGSVVVGWAYPGRAFRWTAAGGMEDLNRTYDDLLPPGSNLLDAYAISPDGRYIVGDGYNADSGRFEAYLLDTQGTGVEEQSGAAGVGVHLQPHPARESVVLQLEVAEGAGGATLEVYDLLGRPIAELLRGAVLPPGVHRVELDVRTWAVGQYTVVLRTGAGSTAVPLVVVR